MFRLLSAALFVMVVASPTICEAYSLSLYVWTAPDGEQPAKCELVMVTPTPLRPTLGSPSWSRDLSKIAFNASYHGRDSQLFVLDLDRTRTSPQDGDERPVRYLGSGTVPTWSPDGSQIAFRRLGKKNKRLGVFLMDASTSLDFSAIVPSPRDTNETDQATRPIERLCDGGWPFWTPDGEGLYLMFYKGVWYEPDEVRFHDVEAGVTYPIEMPTGIEMKSVASLSGNRHFTVVCQDAGDKMSTRVSHFYFDAEPVDGKIVAREEPLVDLFTMQQQLPRDLTFGRFVEPRGATESGETFVTVSVKRTGEDRSFNQIWLFPDRTAGDAKPRAIISARPGVQLRDFAPGPDGRRLVFCSDLHGSGDGDETDPSGLLVED